MSNATLEGPVTNCGVRDCFAHVTVPKVFCDQHWVKLPFELQERVADAYASPKYHGKQPNPEWAEAVVQAAGYLGRAGQ